MLKGAKLVIWVVLPVLWACGGADEVVPPQEQAVPFASNVRNSLDVHRVDYCPHRGELCFSVSDGGRCVNTALMEKTAAATCAERGMRINAMSYAACSPKKSSQLDFRCHFKEATGWGYDVSAISPCSDVELCYEVQTTGGDDPNVAPWICQTFGMNMNSFSNLDTTANHNHWTQACHFKGDTGWGIDLFSVGTIMNRPCAPGKVCFEAAANRPGCVTEFSALMQRACGALGMQINSFENLEMCSEGSRRWRFECHFK